jgi:site-specific DNA recombinase
LNRLVQKNFLDSSLPSITQLRIETRVLRLAYLAPDIIEAIVEGRQPPELTANKLVRFKNFPLDWPGQREALGFPRT